MITEIDTFFTDGCGRCARFATADCSARLWQDGLEALRGICLEAGLCETVKWGHPCYMHAGRNIVLFGAVRGDFRLIFFQAALLQDPEGVLEKQGSNTRHPDMIRFTDAAKVTSMAPILRAYLAEAMRYAEAGLKAPKAVHEPDMPAELTDALDSDPELAEAFHALTPGRQKSYVLHLNGARAPQTRVARIVRLRDRIMAGKGALER